jgi:hypothetical protein
MIKSITRNTCVALLSLMLFPTYSSSSYLYTKETELRPIRLSDGDLQKEIDKISNLTKSANASAAISYRENVTFVSGKNKVEISGHQFLSEVGIPKSSYGFQYSFFTSDEAPISDVSIRFDDYSRRTSVSGNSPEQVDAIFSTIESDFKDYSTLIGGSLTRVFTLVILACIFFMGIVVGLGNCIENKSVRKLGVPISSAIGMILIFTLPFKDILAGFAVYKGDASIIVRYGYQISFASLLIALLGIPLSYYLPSILSSKQKIHKKPSNNGLQQTRKKRR